MSVAFVGLGSNLEEPERQVRDAMRELDAVPGSRVTQRSSLYRSAPVGHAPQPDFVNAVVSMETSLAPDDLLDNLQAIEARHGRERPFANAARTLDLDLLLYDEARRDDARLTLPHPRMHERAFVLAPLLEIAPQARIPGRGAAASYMEACRGQRVARLG